MRIEIGDLLHNSHFKICNEKGVRILQCVDIGMDYDIYKVYEGNYPYTDVPRVLLNQEVCAITVSKHGLLEIGFQSNVDPEEEIKKKLNAGYHESIAKMDTWTREYYIDR